MARKRREYTAAERKELWQRWKQGEPIKDIARTLDRLENPVGCALRGDRPEQSLLAAQHAEVREAIAAVGDRHGEVAHDDTWIVSGAALAGRRHRLRECRRQLEPVGQLHQQEGAGVGDEPLAVRPDFYGLRCRLCLHLPGVLLALGMGFRKPHSHQPRGRSRRVSSGAYR